MSVTAGINVGSGAVKAVVMRCGERRGDPPRPRLVLELPVRESR